MAFDPEDSEALGQITEWDGGVRGKTWLGVSITEFLKNLVR